MFSLSRLLFRKLEGKPKSQLIVGILMIPIGLFISFATITGEYIHPYWLVAGLVFAVFGVMFIIRGATALRKLKPLVQQAMYQQYPHPGQGQYAQQLPYGQPVYPAQAPSEQVLYPSQAYEQSQYPQQ
jgi:hypothetical protein